MAKFIVSQKGHKKLVVDEYIFTLLPVIAGKGKRLMEGMSLQEKLGIKLVDTKVFGSGCVILHYVKP